MSKTPLKRGRPSGMPVRQLELKQTLLEYPDAPNVIETVLRAVLDDNHKNQVATPEFLMDRILPIRTFEKAVDSREKIDIVINTIRSEEEAIEGEVIE